MGNPHAVLFDRATRERAAAVGPAIEAAVPGGVNVGFATPTPAGGLDLVVWERGSGLTEACGTGACAAAVAAVKAGHARPGTPIEVRLPGGPLTITVGGATAHASPSRPGSSEGGDGGAGLDVEMRGPAEKVFEGTTAL
jgi:diaminopimelate epimerase